MDQKNAEKPFFLYLSHKAVHSNFTPAERHADKYKDVDLSFPDTFSSSVADPFDFSFIALAPVGSVENRKPNLRVPG